MDYKKVSKEFKNYIEQSNAITIISHLRPDGDTISSALALYNLFKKLGKRVEVCCIDSDLPINFRFLKGFDRYKTKIDFDDSLVITVDCGDLKRAGFNLDRREIINIDHHKVNTHFGKLNIVDFKAATACVVFNLIKEEFEIDKDIATALYAGVVSDSINFSTSLTSIDTFKNAIELLGYGVDLVEVANYVNKSKTLSHIRLLTYALNSLELGVNGKVSFMIVTEDDFKKSGAKNSDMIGIIDVGLSLITVEVAVFIAELEDKIKVSLRSKNVDISEIAQLFGGGGHKMAAAFEVKDGKILEVKDSLKIILKDYLDA